MQANSNLRQRVEVRDLLPSLVMRFLSKRKRAPAEQVVQCEAREATIDDAFQILGRKGVKETCACGRSAPSVPPSQNVAADQRRRENQPGPSDANHLARLTQEPSLELKH